MRDVANATRRQRLNASIEDSEMKAMEVRHVTFEVEGHNLSFAVRDDAECCSPTVQNDTDMIIVNALRDDRRVGVDVTHAHGQTLQRASCFVSERKYGFESGKKRDFIFIRHSTPVGTRLSHGMPGVAHLDAALL